MDSINNSQKAIIAMAYKQQKQVWNKEMSNKELDSTMPYNALSGKPIYGKDEVLFISACAVNDYKSPQFVEAMQALNLGAILKENELPIRIAVVKDVAYVNAVNKNGEPIINKDKLTWIDRNGEEKLNYVKVRQPLAKPIVETKAFYNIEQYRNPEVLK